MINTGSNDSTTLINYTKTLILAVGPSLRHRFAQKFKFANFLSQTIQDIDDKI